MARKTIFNQKRMSAAYVHDTLSVCAPPTPHGQKGKPPEGARKSCGTHCRESAKECEHEARPHREGGFVFRPRWCVCSKGWRTRCQKRSLKWSRRQNPERPNTAKEGGRAISFTLWWVVCGDSTRTSPSYNLLTFLLCQNFIVPAQAGRVDAGPPTPPQCERGRLLQFPSMLSLLGGSEHQWYDGSRSFHSCYFYVIFFIAHAQMEGWYDRQLVCPRSLYVEVLVPMQKHKLCQTFTKQPLWTSKFG